MVEELGSDSFAGYEKLALALDSLRIVADRRIGDKDRRIADKAPPLDERNRQGPSDRRLVAPLGRIGNLVIFEPTPTAQINHELSCIL